MQVRLFAGKDPVTGHGVYLTAYSAVTSAERRPPRHARWRRISFDTEATVLLREHKDRCRPQMAELGLEFSDEMYVFSGVRDFDSRKSYSPHAVSSRYKDMAERLGINTHIHALEHYSAT